MLLNVDFGLFIMILVCDLFILLGFKLTSRFCVFKFYIIYVGSLLSSIKIIYIHPHTQMKELTCQFEHILLHVNP